MNNGKNDIIIEMGAELVPVETKSGQTLASDFFDGLNYSRDLSGDKDSPAALVYGGDRALKHERVHVYPWFVL